MDWLTGRRGEEEARRDRSPADADAADLAEEVVPLVNAALGGSWYDEYANPVDVAVVRLCRLRRAAAGHGGGIADGDDAVQRALERAEPDAVIWLASRVISYMDEQGYPETMRRWPVEQ